MAVSLYEYGFFVVGRLELFVGVSEGGFWRGVLFVCLGLCGWDCVVGVEVPTSFCCGWLVGRSGLVCALCHQYRFFAFSCGLSRGGLSSSFSLSSSYS